MKKYTILFWLILISGLVIGERNMDLNKSNSKIIKLPAVSYKSSISIEEALKMRRSVREYKNMPLNLQQISQLLWAAQGITSPEGYRTTPSAGALYPLEIYLAAGEVEDLEPGIYKYLPQKHELAALIHKDVRKKLSAAALHQPYIKNAPATIIIVTVYERTSVKYGMRAVQYVHIEVGAATENIYLQAASLNLGTVFIGAFNDNEVKKTLNLLQNEKPLCLMPIGILK
ncbi:MAG: SagB/ThcOx family dehydrogenase [Calditrichia bacterium]|nr:SagB/ThcOx family dehydrogenase [Calditrichia bacterium]